MANVRLSKSKQIKFLKLIIITNKEFRFIVAEQLKELGINYQAIILEPCRKNTAPAILASTLFVLENVLNTQWSFVQQTNSSKRMEIFILD